MEGGAQGGGGGAEAGAGAGAGAGGGAGAKAGAKAGAGAGAGGGAGAAGPLQAQVEGAMRAAMRKVVQEKIEAGDLGHALLLMAEIRARLCALAGSEAQVSITRSSVDVEHAREAHAAGALDQHLVADLVEGAASRIADLGAQAYAAATVEHGKRAGQGLRTGELAPGPALADFFEWADATLTRIEAGIAAFLLQSALLQGVRAGHLQPRRV